MRRLALLGFALALSKSALAWFGTGHMVVAEIAYRRLDPEVRKRANALLAGGDPKNSEFRTAACWADDEKSSKDAHWHYTNYYFRKDGKAAKGKPRDENVVWAIETFTKVLRDPKTTDAQKAEALRYVLHCVGDVHQPLHATAHESDDHPDGDRGGNDFKIEPPQGLRPVPRNLHFLWDSGAGAFEEIVRPLNDSGQRALVRYADACEAAMPFEKAAALIAKMDPDTWARESFEYAKSVTYVGIEPNSTPSAAYLAKARKLSMERVALAGYRLAELLNSTMKPKSQRSSRAWF